MIEKLVNDKKDLLLQNENLLQKIKVYIYILYQTSDNRKQSTFENQKKYLQDEFKRNKEKWAKEEKERRKKWEEEKIETIKNDMMKVFFLILENGT